MLFLTLLGTTLRENVIPADIDRITTHNTRTNHANTVLTNHLNNPTTLGGWPGVGPPHSDYRLSRLTWLYNTLPTVLRAVYSGVGTVSGYIAVCKATKELATLARDRARLENLIEGHRVVEVGEGEVKKGRERVRAEKERVREALEGDRVEKGKERGEREGEEAAEEVAREEYLRGVEVEEGREKAAMVAKYNEMVEASSRRERVLRWRVGRMRREGELRRVYLGREEAPRKTPSIPTSLADTVAAPVTTAPAPAAGTRGNDEPRIRTFPDSANSDHVAAVFSPAPKVRVPERRHTPDAAPALQSATGRRVFADDPVSASPGMAQVLSPATSLPSTAPHLNIKVLQPPGGGESSMEAPRGKKMFDEKVGDTPLKGWEYNRQVIFGMRTKVGVPPGGNETTQVTGGGLKIVGDVSATTTEEVSGASIAVLQPPGGAQTSQSEKTPGRTYNSRVLDSSDVMALLSPDLTNESQPPPSSGKRMYEEGPLQSDGVAKLLGAGTQLFAEKKKIDALEGSLEWSPTSTLTSDWITVPPLPPAIASLFSPPSTTSVPSSIIRDSSASLIPERLALLHELAMAYLVHGCELRSHVTNMSIVYVGMGGFLQDCLARAMEYRGGVHLISERVGEGIVEDTWKGEGAEFVSVVYNSASAIAYEYTPPPFVNDVVSKRHAVPLRAVQKKMIAIYEVMWRLRQAHRAVPRGGDSSGGRMQFLRFLLFEMNSFVAGLGGYVDASLAALYDDVEAALDESKTVEEVHDAYASYVVGVEKCVFVGSKMSKGCGRCADRLDQILIIVSSLCKVLVTQSETGGGGGEGMKDSVWEYVQELKKRWGLAVKDLQKEAEKEKLQLAAFIV